MKIRKQTLEGRCDVQGEGHMTSVVEVGCIVVAVQPPSVDFPTGITDFEGKLRLSDVGLISSRFIDLSL